AVRHPNLPFPPDHIAFPALPGSSCLNSEACRFPASAIAPRWRRVLSDCETSRPLRAVPGRGRIHAARLGWHPLPSHVERRLFGGLEVALAHFPHPQIALPRAHAKGAQFSSKLWHRCHKHRLKLLEHRQRLEKISLALSRIHSQKSRGVVVQDAAFLQRRQVCGVLDDADRIGLQPGPEQLVGSEHHAIIEPSPKSESSPAYLKRELIQERWR